MNAKLIFKTLFLIVILLFLVLMGMENRNLVKFTMSQVVPGKQLELPAALMYYAFFAIGLLTGTILAAGGKKGAAGGGKTNKVEK